MITHRDEKGRIKRPAGPPHAIPKTRDERSERSSRNPGQFTMRMPEGWRTALDNFAQCERKTLTELVLTALESTYPDVLHPVLRGGKLLQDRAPSFRQYLGQQNARLPRLEDQHPSDITRAIPAFDRMQIAAQKAGYDTVEDWRNAGLPIQGRPPNHPQRRRPKFAGKLTDKR